MGRGKLFGSSLRGRRLDDQATFEASMVQSHQIARRSRRLSPCTYVSFHFFLSAARFPTSLRPTLVKRLAHTLLSHTVPITEPLFNSRCILLVALYPRRPALTLLRLPTRSCSPSILTLVRPLFFRVVQGRPQSLMRLDGQLSRRDLRRSTVLARFSLCAHACWLVRACTCSCVV